MTFLRNLAISVMVLLASSLAECAELPTFLPDYFSPVFKLEGLSLALLNNSSRDGVEQYVYGTSDKTFFLSIQRVKAESPKTKAIMSNITETLNGEINVSGGQFVQVGANEVCAKVSTDGIYRTVHAFAMPTGIQIWTFSGIRNESMYPETKLTMIKKSINKKRYEEAIAEGNVAMGAWSKEITDHALSLLDEENKEEAMSVLGNVVATSPYNFRAHLAIVANTSDRKKAAESAGIIARNAEDPVLYEAAINLQGKAPITYSSIPVLGKGESGLQVILIPLEPCDLSLLDDIAKTYQTITGIPVKVRRLKEPFRFGPPDRIPYERVIQEAIVNLSGEKVDFKGWNKDKYATELLKVVEPLAPLKKYYARELVQKIDKEPGQYLADGYLDWLLKALDFYRGDDERTMYVGITGVNIYSGDNNYLFSYFASRGKSQGSLLSHYMMQTKNASDPYESRKRLVERVAKELVPASLKSLKIPRSTDPTCPYSYSSGTQRLDEKTLQLSESVKEGIAIFKVQNL